MRRSAARSRPSAARQATSHDVARRAGVSQSAVSRAFTSGASIALATREKVMVAASALDYRPNQVARALISERSGLVGLVIPPDFIPLYSLALGEFARRLPTAGLQPLVLTAEASTRADDLVEKFIEYRVDGVILTAATLSSRVAARCAQRGIAVIQFGRAELRARGARGAGIERQPGRWANSRTSPARLRCATSGLSWRRPGHLDRPRPRRRLHARMAARAESQRRQVRLCRRGRGSAHSVALKAAPGCGVLRVRCSGLRAARRRAARVRFVHFALFDGDRR